MQVVVDGTLKELLLNRSPAALHVFNVVEHGRRWLRELVYTSDTAKCYGDPVLGGTFAGQVALVPRPHWTSGDFPSPYSPAPSLVISRSLSHDAPLQYYVPNRYLNGLLPLALISQYRFWRSADGQSLIGHPIPKEGADAITMVAAAAAAAEGSKGAGDGGGAGTDTKLADGGGGANASAAAALAGKEEVTITVGKGGSVVRRTPCDANGTPMPTASRRLIATCNSPPDGTVAKLVLLLERVEDLAHILVWSAAEAEAPSASNPFGSGGGDSDVPISLVELPRLHLSFDVKRAADGVMRLCSREHPGLYAATLDGSARATALLRGLPHALVLLNDEGDAFVLLSALNKPIRLADPADPLSSQLILARQSKTWLSALPGVRHFLFTVHRSQV